ncbi:MAG TPA: DUF2085 domain-containing protein [Candidatus Methanomethylophilaceae archaeon]|nr:DUF2085 domain-containing protein [Candidatus Methanomethylophilaceae archaeon]
MKAGTPGRSISLVLFTLLGLMFLVPFLYEPGTFLNLDGTSGVIDHQWSPGQFIYLLGDMLCHQQMGRSLIINGSQTAFCTRDIGLLAGTAFTLVLTYRIADGPVLAERRILLIGLLLLLMMAAEWATGMFMGYDLKYLRLASGVVGGAGVALILQNMIVGIWKGEGVS